VEYEFVVCMFVVVEVAWGRNGGTGMVVVDSMADMVVGNRRPDGCGREGNCGLVWQLECRLVG
jgi:hypothetical protein